MALYRNTVTGEIRDIDDALITAWEAAGNPKRQQWESYTPPPPPPPPPPAPDWIGFYDGLITSSVYASVLGQATQSTELVAYMVALSAALADAKAGRPNIPAIQSAVDLVATTAQLSPADRAEIESLLLDANLDGVITLPPEP
ncbi:MAG: hypothetical protein ACO3FA_00870 [Vulcanococcus sp.]